MLPYYRKVINGDPAIAGKYFGKAQRMLANLFRSGRKKDIFRNDEITIIAKVINNTCKVLFFPAGLIFVYTEQVTFENVLTIGGWSGNNLHEAGVFDFSEVARDPSSISSIGYGWFLEGESFITMQASASPTSDNPPKFHAPIRNTGGTIAVGEEDFEIDRSDPPNIDALFGRFSEYFRGPDKDYVYTTTGGQAIGDGANPTLWYKEHADETNTWKVSLQMSYPAPDGGLTLFPVWVWDDRFHLTPDGAFHLLSQNGLTADTWSFWKLIEDALYYQLTLFEDTFGGLSKVRPSSLMKNYVNNDMGFMLNELNDPAGDPSDVDAFFDTDGNYVFEVEMSDYLDYVRTEDNKFRWMYTWMIEPDVYGAIFQNVPGVGATLANVGIDAIIKMDNSGDSLVVEVLYEAEIGTQLGFLQINPNNPKEIVFGQLPMNGVSAAPTTHNMLYFDLDNQEPVVIPGTEGVSLLRGLTFVR